MDAAGKVTRITRTTPRYDLDGIVTDMLGDVFDAQGKLLSADTITVAPKDNEDNPDLALPDAELP